MSTPEPKPEGKDNLALAKYAKALRRALTEANIDKAALRSWYYRVSGGNSGEIND
jgi:hypothetical protein